MGEPGPFVLATTNPNKAREIREIFAACWSASSSCSTGRRAWPTSKKRSPLCSATLASRHVPWSRRRGWPAIAEDTGIEVEALGGAPGVRSARYAGEPADDEANVDKVLAELAGKLGPGQRRARFVTVAVAMWPDGREIECGGGG